MSVDNHITASAIFFLQTIQIDDIKLNLFFESGCGDMVIKTSTVDKLADVGREKQILSGPLEITGVGDKKSVWNDGVYSVSLPLYNRENAILSGLCMPKIMADFLFYALHDVEKDIRNKCKDIGGAGVS